MSSRCALLTVSLLVLTGCATAYKLPPLTTEHPAHPEATATPEQPPSNTLSYRPSDIPSPRPASHMAQRGTQGSRPSEPASRQTFVGEGKVIAVIPSSDQIVVKHGEIQGFMEAMTMGFRVDPPSLLKEVKAGDSIRFIIDTHKKAIVKIEKSKK